MPSVDQAAITHAFDVLFAPDAETGVGLAALVMVGGKVVAERYGVQPDTLFGPGSPVTAETTLISWSMAKSITHAAVGILVGDGRLDPAQPAPVPSWAATPKAAITLKHLLEMRSGLAFVEDYVDGTVSNCLEMLYGAGADDMAAYAAGLPLLYEPGTVWNYSSGTTNIIARIVGDVVGGGREGTEVFLRDRLFEPTGMHSAIPKFDTHGTFVGSSYVYATARDFARFGEMYRNDGVIGDLRVLPAGWAEHARTFVAHDPDSETYPGDPGFDYGRQWWMWSDLPGSMGCHGYEGQFVVVVPDRDLVLVHLGKTPAERFPLLKRQLSALIEAVQPE